MKKGKRIAALIGVALLIGLYLMTFISSFMAKPYAGGLFMASLFCTVVVPILIYGFLIIYKQVHKGEGEEGISIRELKKRNKKMEKGKK